MNKFLFKIKKMPIGSRITAIYTLLFSIILIIISCFILANTWVYYNSISKNEILAAADSVEKYILTGGEITRENLKRVVNNNYIEVKVNTRDNALNTGTMEKPDLYPKMDFNEPPFNIPPDNMRKNNFEMKRILESEYMFAHRVVEYDGKTYNIQVFRLFNHEQSMINLFLIIFIISNILAVIIAYFIGRYISNKMLKPIREITTIADNISINDLKQRITVPETDDEIKTLIVTFNDMIARLDESFDKQKQFISDASHELKTPIAVIQGYINLIDRWGKSDEDVLKESIDSIKYETEHMNKLIQQLLFLARADNDKCDINKETLSLNEIASDVLKDICVLVESVSTELIADKNVNIYGDEQLIRQLMWIFCENAIKYKADKPLNIKITVGEKNTVPYFSVTDNGIGISQEDISHIFDRFYRADKSRNKTIMGNGLGLSIASWIAKIHDAKIFVQSETNKGTEFTVTFENK